MIPMERLDRLDALIERGDLLRGRWTFGRDRACLLAALSPEAGVAQSASQCPAELMPPWLAELTPWIDDQPSVAAWPAIVRRYAALARRWHVLDAAAWERARVGALIAIVVEARSHVAASETQALAAIDGVLAWLRAGAPEDQRAAAAAAAAREAAVAAAREAAKWAAWAAAAAAREAAWAAEEAAAALRAAAAAAAAAREAAVAAAREAAKWAAWAAWAAEEAEEAADRIATGVLDAIEREIVANALRIGGER